VHELGRHDVAIALRAPDGGEVVRIDGEMNLAGGARGVRDGILVPHILNMDGLVFPVAGRYAFDVVIDGEHHVSIPLTVDGPQASAQA
jgi:hypothetical protein